MSLLQSLLMPWPHPALCLCQILCITYMLRIAMTWMRHQDGSERRSILTRHLKLHNYDLLDCGVEMRVALSSDPSHPKSRVFM